MTFRSLGFFASSGGVAAAPGMVLLTPTSIAHSGTSASIGANGQVTFTAVTSLSLNGVFSADFDNYVIASRLVVSSVNSTAIRFRVSGADNSTASSYVSQEIFASGTSVTAGRTTANQGYISRPDTEYNGLVVSVYGPFLASPTAWRGVAAQSTSWAAIVDYAGTHNQSTSYDGFTIKGIAGTETYTGTLQVYGVRS